MVGAGQAWNSMLFCALNWWKMATWKFAAHFALHRPHTALNLKHVENQITLKIVLGPIILQRLGWNTNIFKLFLLARFVV